MITAAIHGTTVAPTNGHHPKDELSLLAAEIAERLVEMNECHDGAGADLILRLASMARIDRGAFHLVISVLHGDTNALTDSYAERAQLVGRKKQTVHYRTMEHIESIRTIFPEVCDILSSLRLSVKLHEDPIAIGQIIRDANE